MNKIFLPTVVPQDWQKLLADPEKQWRTGYSARTIAYTWEAAKGHFPPEVERIFPEAGDEKVGNLENLLEFPEWKVYLPPAGHTSQNDLFVLANGEQGLVTIMVEGKVAEPFGVTLESWLNSPTPGKLKRLAFCPFETLAARLFPEAFTMRLQAHETFLAKPYELHF